MSNIDNAIAFLRKQFEESIYFIENPTQKEYRLNHTFRVANIGKQIAIKEGLDVEALVIGCLLHDISYIYEMTTKEERLGHGRLSAKISREFIESLDIAEDLKKQILFGIAIHVDDQADFDGEHTVLANTISDCDNIDRFDKYRLYESLLYSDLESMLLNDQIEFVAKRIEGLNKLKNYNMHTEAASILWNEKLDYQIEYFTLLKEQLMLSYDIV